MSPEEMFTQEAPELVGSGVQALVERARSLGLTWTMRLATVTSASPAKVLCDGDTGEVTAFSMLGSIVVGMRVYVMLVPPNGIYIVGTALALGAGGLAVPYGIHGNGISDSTTSATFVSMAAPSSFTFVKLYDETRIRVQVTVGFFSNNSNTGADIGVLIDGVDYQISRYGATISTGVHLQTTGVQYVPLSGTPPTAGSYTVQGRWRRAAGVGTGQIARDLNDWLSIEAVEIV